MGPYIHWNFIIRPMKHLKDLSTINLPRVSQNTPQPGDENTYTI